MGVGGGLDWLGSRREVELLTFRICHRLGLRRWQNYLPSSNYMFSLFYHLKRQKYCKRIFKRKLSYSYYHIGTQTRDSEIITDPGPQNTS